MRTLNPTILNQSALHTMQGVVESILKLDFLNGRRRGRPPKSDYRLKVLQQDLTHKGDLLLDALRLEQHFATQDLGQAPEGVLEEFRECRRIVDCLTEDYTSALAK